MLRGSQNPTLVVGRGVEGMGRSYSRYSLGAKLYQNFEFRDILFHHLLIHTKKTHSIDSRICHSICIFIHSSEFSKCNNEFVFKNLAIKWFG